MLTELNTNYAYKLKYMGNPAFDKVRDLSSKFYRELPQALQDELHEALNRGIDILDSEPQMTAYLFSFGKMHQAKLKYAFNHLPEEFLSQPEISIVDYGCGQALGTMCYADFLRSRGYVQEMKTVTLIEPSECCLKRAALHTSVFFPNAEIRIIHKTFDELCKGDICCDEYTPTLHILSNVLDMLNFDLEHFSNLVKQSLEGYNQFVCVGPCFFDCERDRRIYVLFERVGGNECFSETLDQYKLDPNKAWTCKVKVFTQGNLLKQFLSTKWTEEDFHEKIVDEFGSLCSVDGKRLLKFNSCARVGIINIRTEIICDEAFYDCYLLQEIVIPNSVTSIGDSAFSKCRSLQQIIIPNSVTSIGDDAFNECESLQQIIIPNSVKSIGNGAFNECESLQQIIIPNSITSIGDFAFRCCRSLRQIIIPNSVTSIGDRAFCLCRSLQRIIIPNSVKSIGNGAFSKCESLQQIIIPNSVTSIGDDAFDGCESLQQIIIPNSVKSIGNGAFSYCDLLRQVIIPDSVTSIGDRAFFFCRSLQQVVIPDSVTSIGDEAFAQQCFIPASITGGGFTFFAGSLPQIVIPKGSKEKFKTMLDKELWDKLVEQ